MKNYYYLQYQLLVCSLLFYYLFYSIAEYPYVVQTYSVAHGYNIASDFGGIFKNYYIYIVNNITILKILFSIKMIFCIGVLFDKSRKISLSLLLFHNYFFQKMGAVDPIEMRFLNFLIVILLFVPEDKFKLFGSYKKTFWTYPKEFQMVAYIVTGIGYSMGGYYKLLTPRWWEGSYLVNLYSYSHLRRFNLDILLSFDFFKLILVFLNYLVVFVEFLALPMMLFPITRFVSIIFLTGMQITILVTLNMSQVSLGMLVFHIFLFDPKWLRLLPKSRK